ncbi:hypothetical protein EZV62_024509 [Acer yangbiense]|uniref:Uncharacterized protein n=1 Tax=Acer yangbiense TaxID=1000413 RepID=A0A5C7GV16_9ROSI|nr:hypothetical protein EZV62_024509 [Acer yangbiense]
MEDMEFACSCCVRLDSKNQWKTWNRKSNHGRKKRLKKTQLCWEGNLGSTTTIPRTLGQRRKHRKMEQMRKLRKMATTRASTLKPTKIQYRLIHVVCNGSAHQYNATDSSYVSDANSTDEELNLKTNEFEIPSTETNNGNRKHLENESLSGLSPVTVQKLHDKKINNLEDLQNTPQGDAEVDLIEEIDNEFTDLDVERVLQKQNTHDLYCPNCNSCITTRVVLRRRRRRVRNIRYKTKPVNNLETPTELDASYQGFDEHNVSPNGTRPTPPANDHNNIGQRNVSPNGTPTPPAIDHNNNTQNGTPAPPAIDHNNDTQNGTPTPPAVDRNTEIFRCLSCFSLFVPTGIMLKAELCDDVIIDVEPQPNQMHPAQTHHVQTKPVLTHLVQIQPGQTQPGQTLPGQTQLGQMQPDNMQPIRTVESSNWDILKSIVYGGLVESITSLGVVSSTAGAGATTLMSIWVVCHGSYYVIRKRKLQEAALKAEAAELKKMEKEKLKWEKGKFAQKSMVAEIDAKVVELGPVGDVLGNVPSFLSEYCGIFWPSKAIVFT